MLDLRNSARAPVSEEFADAQLGDARRTRRLQRIADRVAGAPSIGFPQMVANDSELEGFYRFFGCEAVDFDEVLRPHLDATLARMRSVEGPVLIVHDTTDLSFGGLHPRDGLGPTHGKSQGFLLHLALAVVPGEERLPLGTCGVTRVCRTEIKSTRRKSWYEMSKDPNRESLRWGQLAAEVESRCRDIDCIHVMDREADNYDLFASFIETNARFVVRGCHDRALANGDRLAEQLQQLKPKARREIMLTERIDDGRRKGDKRKHPPRRRRTAKVAIAGRTVVLRKTQSAHSERAELQLNVVYVWEPKVPAAEPAVSWILYTTDPIETEKQLIEVVDHYRSRWVVEEFFKALKTGCSIEKRQLESYHALSIALAIFIPVAWRLLLARSLSRSIPDAPARVVATEIQLQLLRHELKLKNLPTTAEAATLAIAKLGGHLKRNGLPGWLTLGRGMETLLTMEAGWRAAVAAGRSDQ